MKSRLRFDYAAILHMTNNINWVEYPDTKPEKSGYYQAVYKNPLHEDLLFKALWYSAEAGMFQGHWTWAWEYDGEYTDNEGRLFKKIKHHPLDVKKFIPESRNDFYVPCAMWTPNTES